MRTGTPGDGRALSFHFPPVACPTPTERGLVLILIHGVGKNVGKRTLLFSFRTDLLPRRRVLCISDYKSIRRMQKSKTRQAP